MTTSKHLRKCPNCHALHAFHVLSIASDSYFQCCLQCKHIVHTELPRVSKRTIYIDQHAISHMAKSAVRKNDDTWFELFKRLDFLVKAQLIVCPESEYHFVESTVAGKWRAPFERLVTHLAGNTYLYDTDTIIRFQFEQTFKQLLQNSPSMIYDFSPDSIIESGLINGWQERVIFSSNYHSSERNQQQLRENRYELARDLTDVFRRWQKEKRTLIEFYREESTSYGRSILSNCSAYLDGRCPVPIHPHWTLFNKLCDCVNGNEIGREIRKSEVTRFLLSNLVCDIPCVKISSAIFAKIAKMASDGQKNIRMSGLANDVSIISAYLPYFDAMLIDKEMMNILRSGDVRKLINHDTFIFSKANITKLFEWLDGIREGASEEHIALVKMLYNPNLESPTQILKMQ